MLKVTEGALEFGIKVVFEERKGGVTMNCYIDDYTKFDEDCFYIGEEDKAVHFEMKPGELIGKGEIGYYITGEAYLHQFKPTEKYMNILPRIEFKEDYVDLDDYDDRFMDAGEAKPIYLCDSLTTYFIARMDGYKGEFWQYIHPDVEQFYLYQ